VIGGNVVRPPSAVGVRKRRVDCDDTVVVIRGAVIMLVEIAKDASPPERRLRAGR
jgi:hypothetical protein